MNKIDSILEKLGIQLNAMQSAAFDTIANRRNNVVILSTTGSGKTYAYLFPLVKLLDENNDQLQAVVITPGRELALQSATVLKDMGAGIRCLACYGGRPTMDEHRTIKQVMPQVVFGTPGRLNDHFSKGNLSTYGIKFIIIDEFDKCLEMGFLDEMQSLIGKLPEMARRILLSATDSEEISHFVEKTISGKKQKIEKLDFRQEDEQVSSRVKIYKVKSPEKDKLETLAQLLLVLGDESSIVFLNHRDSVERTADFLKDRGFSLSYFHGGMEQKRREDALYSFSNGSANIFVSTDLASRGLDIPNIDNIIHYHLPESEDGYIHRVGRTARWENKGKAYFILGPQESIPEYVDADVEDYAGMSDADFNDLKPAQPKMATIYIGKGKKDKISKGDIVGYLCKKGGLKSDEIGKIDVKDRYAYVAVKRVKLRQVLRQVQGEKIKGIKTVVEEVR